MQFEFSHFHCMLKQVNKINTLQKNITESKLLDYWCLQIIIHGIQIKQQITQYVKKTNKKDDLRCRVKTTETKLNMTKMLDLVHKDF